MSLRKPPIYIYEIDRRQVRAVLRRRRILKRDETWVIVPHPSKSNQVVRVFRHNCIYSIREAWRKHLPQADLAVVGSRRNLASSKIYVVQAERRLARAIVEQKRVHTLAKKGDR